MSDVKQMWIMMKYQFKNYMRAKRLYILLLITTLVIALIVSVNVYFGNPSEEPVKNTASSFANFSEILVVLTALFFGGDAIASEYQNKTGYFLLPNPIRRYVIYWGKYLASLLASLIVLLFYLISGLLYTFYFHSTIPVEYLYSILYSFVFLVSLLAFTYLFSTFFKNGAVALTIVAILYFFVFNIIDGVSQIASVEPWFSITYAAGIITLVFQGSYMGDYPHSQVIHAGKGLTITMYSPYLWEGVAIMLGYFIISVILGTLVFQRKEMK